MCISRQSPFLHEARDKAIAAAVSFSPRKCYARAEIAMCEVADGKKKKKKRKKGEKKEKKYTRRSAR